MKRVRESDTENCLLLEHLKSDAWIESKKGLSMIDLLLMSLVSKEMRVLIKNELIKKRFSLEYLKKCSPCGHQYMGHDCNSNNITDPPCLSGKNVILHDDIGYCRSHSLPLKSVCIHSLNERHREFIIKVKIHHWLYLNGIYKYGLSLATAVDTFLLSYHLGKEYEKATIQTDHPKTIETMYEGRINIY